MADELRDQAYSTLRLAIEARGLERHELMERALALHRQARRLGEAAKRPPEVH